MALLELKNLHVALEDGHYCAFAAHDGNNAGLHVLDPEQMVVYDFAQERPRRLGAVEKARLHGWEDDPVPLKRARRAFG